MCDECYQLWAVSLLQHLRDSADLEVTMEVTSGVVVTVLSVVRPCEKEVLVKGP
jgi:hypothetical protein